jgi:hypothetical protein
VPPIGGRAISQLPKGEDDLDLKAYRCCMDRALLLQAERHVAEGEQHLLWQEELIAELDRDGHDTEEARVILDEGAYSVLCVAA